MRDFGWADDLWAVVKEDGTFAGVPCTSYAEALDLSAQHPDSEVFSLRLEPEDEEEQEENFDDYFPLDLGFDPYEGAYTFDC